MQKEKFEKLYGLDISKYVEKRKNGTTELSYLSWANAIKLISMEYPDFKYEIMKWNDQYFTGDENIGYMVGTKVTMDGDTKEMWLPVMDGANNPLKLEPYEYSTKSGFKKKVAAINMFDINKAIMRCLTKNLAMFGLGLSLYIGEDLPDNIPEMQEVKPGQDLSKEYVTNAQIDMIKKISKDMDPESKKKLMAEFKITKIENLLKSDANNFIQRINSIKKAQEVKNG